MPHVKSLILTQREYSDFDKIFTILTGEDKKLSAIAKGVRKPSAKLRSALQPFYLIDIRLVGKSDLKTIAGADIIEEFKLQENDMERTALGYYFLELVDHWLEEDAAVEGVFNLLVEVLSALQETEKTKLLRTYLEVRLLSVLGTAPGIYRGVISGEKLSEGEDLFFSSEGGGVLKAKNADKESSFRISHSAVKVLRLMVSAGWEEVSRVSGLTDRDVSQMREAIGNMVVSRLNRNLSSLVFLRKLSELG